MSWLEEKARKELTRIREARDKQVYPYFRPFESGGLHTTIDGKPIVNFSSNDYLGLTNHPKVKEAAKEAVDRFAVGLSSSRVQATTTAHVELEERLADWFGFEKCLLFTTGYQAMVGTIMSLADKNTTLILDNLSHACILDGTFLAAGTPTRQPEVRFFNHNSVRSLERILKNKERENAIVLIEGIYSLDGDEAKLVEIVELCEKYDAFLILDDAHGTGTLGKSGKGIVEKYGLEGRVPLIVSTFSKTFGGIGGILVGQTDIVEHVKHYARSFLFSASLPVPIVAAASTILTMLENDGEGAGGRAARKARLHARPPDGDRLRPRRQRHPHHAGHVPRRAQGALHARGAPRERRDDGSHHLSRREGRRRAPPPQRHPRPQPRGPRPRPRAPQHVRRSVLRSVRRGAGPDGDLVAVVTPRPT